MASIATLRPDRHNQPPVEMTRADEARLAIIEPIIDDRRDAAGKHLAGPRGIKTAMPEREIALRRIERHLQLIVPPINVKGDESSAPLQSPNTHRTVGAPLAYPPFFANGSPAEMKSVGIGSASPGLAARWSDSRLCRARGSSARLEALGLDHALRGGALQKFQKCAGRVRLFCFRGNADGEIVV